MFNPDLGGGALLDMGIYPLTFATLMLGPADSIAASATLSDQGVDLDVSLAGRHGDAVSALTASMTSASPRTATIATTTGRLDLPASFHAPAYATWTPSDGEPERIDGLEPVIGTGLGNEAAHVQECLHAGRLESPLVPHAQTLTLIRQMDDIRRQIGVATRRTRSVGSPGPKTRATAPAVRSASLPELRVLLTALRQCVVDDVERVLRPLDRTRHVQLQGRACPCPCRP